MPPLSSLLLQRGVATLEQVEGALARQASRGGDLVTNLLEVVDVDEAQLVEVVADCEGLRPASPGALPAPDSETRQALPAPVAARYRIFPLRLIDDTLIVAVSEPLPSSVERDLAFTLGLRLDQRITTTARIHQALAETYGETLDRRFQRLVARLEGLSDPSPSLLPYADKIGDSSLPPRFPHGPVAGPHLSLPPRPLAASPAPASPDTLLLVPPSSRPATTAPPAAPTDSTPPSSQPDAVGAQQSRRVFQTRPVRARRRRRGPFTLVMAHDALDQAETTGAALRVLFDFTRQFFEYTTMFVVREDLAEGTDAAGPGATRERIRAIGVPLEMPSILSQARERCAPVLDVPSDEGIDAVLRQDLQRPMHSLVLALPLAVRNRVVAVLLGDDGVADVDLGQVGDVLALAPLVSSAIEKLVLQRKLERSSLSSFPLPSRAQPPELPPQPPPAEPPEPKPRRRITLTGVQQPQPAVAPEPAPVAAAPVIAPHPEQPSVPVLRAVTSSFDPAHDQAQDAPPAARPLISPVAVSVRAVGAATVDVHTVADALQSAAVSPVAASVRGGVWDPTPLPLNAEPTPSPLIAPSGDDAIVEPVESVVLCEPTHDSLPDSWLELSEKRSSPTPARAMPSAPSVATLVSAREHQEVEADVQGAADDDWGVWDLPPPEHREGASSKQAAVEPSQVLANVPVDGSAEERETGAHPLAGASAVGETEEPVAGARAHAPAEGREGNARAGAPNGEPQTDARQDGSGEARAEDAPELIMGEVDDDDEMMAAVLEELQKSPTPAKVIEVHHVGQTPAGAIVEGPRMPPKSFRPSDFGLPLVIVNVRGEVDLLLDRIEGDIADDEAARLREGIAALGPTALQALAERFPGVLTTVVDPGRERFLPASKSGPLLRLAVELGAAFGPMLEGLLRHAEPERRLWATAVAAEAGIAQAATAVAATLFDADERVRAVARSCLAEAAGSRQWANSVRGLVHRVSSKPTELPRRRVMALEALGALREDSSVPLLIDALAADDPDVRAAAHQALRKVTLYDLPDDPAQWASWWEDHGTRGRFEWLVEALLGEDGSCRMRAREELVQIVGDDFGYEPEASEQERARVAEAFRAWWAQAGVSGPDKGVKDSSPPDSDGETSLN